MRALFTFRQALRLLQPLAFLAALRKLFFLSAFHFSLTMAVVTPPERTSVGHPAQCGS